MNESNQELLTRYERDENADLASEHELRRQVLEMLDLYGVRPGSVSVKRRANMDWNFYRGEILIIEVRSKDCPRGGSLEDWPFVRRS